MPQVPQVLDRPTPVGPELLPLYVAVLKIVLAAVVGSCLVAGVVKATLLGGADGGSLGTTIGIVLNGAFVAFGAVTLGFMLLRSNAAARSNILTAWEPLLRLTPMRSIGLRRASRFENAAAIIAHSIFVLWWTGVLQLERFIPLSAAQNLRLDYRSVWDQIFWPVLVFSIALIDVNVVRLFGMTSRRLDHGLDLVLQLALIAMAAFVLHAGLWVTVSGSGMAADAMSQVDLGLNIGLRATLVVTICVATLLAGVHARRLCRSEPSPSQA